LEITKATALCFQPHTQVRATEIRRAHRPASQILRELMREFIKRQHHTRDYDAFLREKVEAARAPMRAGQGRIDELAFYGE
jgi:hypothetical protein